MLWSFLLIPQRTTLHHPTVNFEVKSMLFQLCYRSNTDCIFRLRGGCNCARSEVANYERSFISQINVAVDENSFWWHTISTANISRGHIKQNKRDVQQEWNRIKSEIYCCVPNILRVSFTQYNNCRYRIYWAWYFSLATKKLSNM